MNINDDQLERLQRRVYVDTITSIAGVAAALFALIGLLLGWWS